MRNIAIDLSFIPFYFQYFLFKYGIKLHFYEDLNVVECYEFPHNIFDIH